jgi:hypothetical protein
MVPYTEYKPSGLDPAGAFIEGGERDWLVVPTGQNRDSSHAERSNFAAALALMGGEGDDVHVHRFGHWAVGWVEIILARPGSEAACKAEDIERRLARYPLLDEDDVSAREHDSYCSAWESWGASEFVQELVKKFSLGEDAEDLLDGAGGERLREFFQALNPAGDYSEDGAPVIRRSVCKASRDDVDAFIASLDGPVPGV